MTELNSKKLIANSKIMGAELRNLARFMMGNSYREEVPKPYTPTEEEIVKEKEIKTPIVEVEKVKEVVEKNTEEKSPETNFVKDIQIRLKNLQEELQEVTPPKHALIVGYEKMKSSEKKRRINKALTTFVQILSKGKTLDTKDVMDITNQIKTISNTCNKQQYLKMLESVIEKLSAVNNPIAKDIAEAIKAEREQEILRKKFNLVDYVNNIYNSVGDYEIKTEDIIVLAKLLKMFLDNIETLSFDMLKDSKEFKAIQAQLSDEFMEAYGQTSGNESTEDLEDEETPQALSPEEMQEFVDFYNEVMNEK